jgi:exodeoxyribonuclease VII small subunit
LIFFRFLGPRGARPSDIFGLCSFGQHALTLTATQDWTHFEFCFMVPVVPSTPKNAGHNSPAKAEDLPFEEALKKLEAIVEAMESEDLPLETLLAKYEEGTRLSRVCQEKLAEAEVKIQQLEKNAAGELKVKPLTLEESEAE